MALDALVRLTRCYGGNKTLWRARSASRSGGRRRAFRTPPAPGSAGSWGAGGFRGEFSDFRQLCVAHPACCRLCNAVLEIIPLRLCIGSAPRPLRRVGLDRQRATLLGKLRADWTGGLRAIRRRGFSRHGGCGKEKRDEHCKNLGSRGCISAISSPARSCPVKRPPREQIAGSGERRPLASNALIGPAVQPFHGGRPDTFGDCACRDVARGDLASYAWFSRGTLRIHNAFRATYQTESRKINETADPVRLHRQR